MRSTSTSAAQSGAPGPDPLSSLLARTRNTMKLTTRVSTSTAAFCAAATLLAACGGGGSSSTAASGDDSNVVDGGTFTMALKSDPGNLDPQSSAQSALFTVTQLAYD